MKFSVIDDYIGAQGGINYFDDFNMALEYFNKTCATQGMTPMLSVQTEECSLDFLFGIDGKAVFVPKSYAAIDQSLPEDTREAFLRAQDDLRWTAKGSANVQYELMNEILPSWAQAEVKVIVPDTLEQMPSNYCYDNTILRTTRPDGLDAIDSLYIENHGWITYDEFLNNPDVYAPDGFISVTQLKVAHATEKKVGSDNGYMNITPMEFSDLVEKTNKPYMLKANNYIVASFDDIGSAVKAWYDVQGVQETQGQSVVPMSVCHHSPKHDDVVFNGYENKKRVSYNEAAKKFGFEGASLSDKLAAAFLRGAELGAETSRKTREAVMSWTK